MKNVDHWYPKGTLAEPFLPVEVDKTRKIFPANVDDLMPPAGVIPDEFRDSHNTWVKLVETAFYTGLKSLKNLELIPRDNVDPQLAWDHVMAILGSFQPKQEYKIAATAYLLSLWFESVTWDK